MVFWANLRRLAHIVRVIAKHGLARVVAARWPKLARHVPAGMLSGPERLRAALEELGGTFIKFGQLLALQPDILSLEYCNALFSLLDRMPPFPYEQVEQIFKEEFGRTTEEVFDVFNRHPIASASIGQVHVAHLGGRKLAVKVRRPTVETDFVGDLRLMTAAMRAIKGLRIQRFQWLIEPLREFVAWTREELDYRREARYMAQLGRNARDNPRERVPAVLWEYTTGRVLTAEFLDGMTVLEHLRALGTGDALMQRRLKLAGFEPNRFARNIIDNFLGDAFQHGIFHADLHPANLMILSGNVVGYIDFGITGVLSRYSRQNMVALTLAMTRGDLDGMCTPYFRVSAMDATSDIEGFRAGLSEMAEHWYELRGRERRLRKNITLIMLDMLTLSRRTNIMPEREVIKYIRSAITVDGLITRFAPGFDVGRHLEMICERSLKWQARRMWFSYDTLLGWSSSSGRLFGSGAFRVASALERVATGEVPARIEAKGTADGGGSALRLRALELAAIIFTVSWLMTVTGGRVQLGVNVLTAGALLVAASATMLWRTIRGLA